MSEAARPGVAGGPIKCRLAASIDLDRHGHTGNAKLGLTPREGWELSPELSLTVRWSLDFLKRLLNYLSGLLVNHRACRTYQAQVSDV